MKYTIIPYHGYDCDSVNGFNNGRRLDTIIVYAANEDEARSKALEAYVELNGVDLKKVERDGWFGDNTLYFEHEVVDQDGRAVDTNAEGFEFNESEHSYAYEYVDFNYIEVQEEGEAL